MRTFDRVIAVILLILATGTVTAAYIGEDRRARDAETDRVAIALQRDALEREANAARERARLADALALEAARLRSALVALALADNADQRAQAILLLGDAPLAQPSPPAEPSAAPGPSPEPSMRASVRTGPTQTDPPPPQSAPAPAPKPGPRPPADRLPGPVPEQVAPLLGPLCPPVLCPT